MHETISIKDRIIDETVHDESGRLTGQKLYEITTKHGTESTIKTVKMIFNVRGNNNEFKEYVVAEASVIFPNIDESGIMIRHLMESCFSDNDQSMSKESEIVFEQEPAIA